MTLKNNPLYKIIRKAGLNYLYKLPNKSYSQEGEDLILNRYFDYKPNGFYIDIGAYHPTRFSNTYLFYKKGWKGINIEARPGSKEIFDKVRKRDLNIEAAVSDEIRELIYYKFNEPALNGFSKEISLERNKSEKYKIIEEIKIQTTTLKELFSKQLKPNSKIDFMTIDVEGHDLKVLKSNDWKLYRPNIVLVEDINFNIMEPSRSDVFNLMIEKKYSLIAKAVYTLFFKDSNLT